MNTIEEMIQHGIDRATAERTLEIYRDKIGTMNGIYEIVDITYNFDTKGRDVTLKCTLCGRTIHRMMIRGRNKWRELIKSCPCQTEERKQQKEIENAEKKKSEILKKVGNVYGDYQITSVIDLDNNPKYLLRCIKCGEEKEVSAISFYRRKKFHCTKHYSPEIKFDERYIGKKNNHLLVIGIVRTKNNRKKFKCRCDCGRVTLVEPALWENGEIKSCGCLKKSYELIHNESLDRLRRIYDGMIQRCYNKNSNAYKYYGGRGIMVCEEWKNNRDSFMEWALKNGYSNTLTIDRINNNGIYEPNNCRWATYTVQANNRRTPVANPNRKKITKTIDGKVKTLQEWYGVYNTSAPAIHYRMKIKNMTFEEALKTPKLAEGRPRKEN